MPRLRAIRCPGSLQYRLGQEHSQVLYGNANAQAALGELELGFPPNGGSEAEKAPWLFDRSFLDFDRHASLLLSFAVLVEGDAHTPYVM
jgi:hypothetical protein